MTEEPEDNRDEGNKESDEVAGYPLKELAKAPVAPPDPDDYTSPPIPSTENVSPQKASIFFGILGLAIFIVGVIAGLAFGLLVGLLICIIGLIAIIGSAVSLKAKTQ